jgi:putative glutamine amidotransferase
VDRVSPRRPAGRRPLIGVTTSSRGGRSMWWFNKLALLRAGARAVRITPDDPFPIGRLDGLVIGGGDDINAILYGGAVNPAIRIDPARDALELRVLDWVARLCLPTLGICRGAQMINVHRGGTLHTDIHEIYARAPRMRTVLPRKFIDIDADSRLRAVLGIARCRVNALHHQSIAGPGDGVAIVAHDAFGIVQGIEVRDCPYLYGVQWHPEFLVFDRHQQNLFHALVDAARQKSPLPAGDAAARREAVQDA